MESYILHKACTSVCYESVKVLLSAGVDANSKDSFGRTPLHCLFSTIDPLSYWDPVRREREKKIKLDIARLLFDFGADVNAVSHEGTGLTPLHLAVSRCDDAMVELFLSKGAKPWMRNALGKTSLHLAVQSNYYSFIDKYLQIESGLDVIDYEGRTPLHDAVFYLRETELIQSLVSRGSNVSWKDSVNRTPLHCAIKENKLNFVRLLIESGSDIESTDTNGMTPLHYAVKVGSCDIARLLLSRNAEVNCRNGVGETPLHLAVKTDKYMLLNLLLKFKADCNAQDDNGCTPLHLALELPRTSHEIVNYLLRFDTNMNLLNVRGHSSLDLVQYPHCDNEIRRLVVRHALKLKAAKLTVFTKKSVELYLNSVDQCFYNKCQQEILNIKNNNLYYILTCSINKLSKILKDEMRRSYLFSLKYRQQYPIYCDLISFKLKAALVRTELVSKCEKQFPIILNSSNNKLPYIPPECFYFIFQFLSQSDLELLLRCCSNF